MEWFICLDYFNDGSFQEIPARLRSPRGAILALCPLAIERTTTTWRGRLLRLAISGNSGNPCKIRGIPTAPNPSSAVRGIFLADFGSEFVECSGTGGFFHRG